MLVLGRSRRSAFERAVQGSVSRTLARKGSWPLVVARSSARTGRVGPVICGVAADADADPAPARVAAALAARLGSPLVLAQAISAARTPVLAGGALVPVPARYPDSRERAAAEDRLAAVADRVAAPDVLTLILDGRPAEELDRLAEECGAELLVVGCRGGGVVRTALHGSVSLDLTRGDGCPIVIVPPDWGP